MTGEGWEAGSCRLAYTPSNDYLTPAGGCLPLRGIQTVTASSVWLMGELVFEASGWTSERTIIRIHCMHDYSAEYEYIIRPTIRTA